MIKNTIGLPPRLFKALHACMFPISVLAFAAPIPFVLRLCGFQYLPNPDTLLYLPTWSYWIFGITLSLPLSIILVGVAKSFIFDSKLKEGLVLFLAAFGFSFALGVVSNLFFGATIPTLHTAMYGEEGHIKFSMRKSYDMPISLSRLGCKGGVGVETGVVSHSILCGMELEPDHGLPLARNGRPKPGAIITVHGKASRAGIFYKSFEVGE